jgi:hypothetical protein
MSMEKVAQEEINVRVLAMTSSSCRESRISSQARPAVPASTALLHNTQSQSPDARLCLCINNRSRLTCLKSAVQARSFPTSLPRISLPSLDDRHRESFPRLCCGTNERDSTHNYWNAEDGRARYSKSEFKTFSFGRGNNVCYRRCKVLLAIPQQREARIDTVEGDDGYANGSDSENIDEFAKTNDADSGITRHAHAYAPVRE